MNEARRRNAISAVFIVVGCLLLAAATSQMAKASLGALSLSRDTYNYDGSPGSGTVDFGLLGDPALAATVSPAIVFHVSSDLEWRLSATMGGTLPVGCALEQRGQGSGTWTALSDGAPAILLDAQGPCGPTDISDELRLTVPWALPPGVYSVDIVYEIAFTDQTPPAVSSFAINAGAQYANASAWDPATLDYVVTDNSGVVDAMCFSNDGLAWTAWEDCAPSATRPLPGPDGVNTVWVKFRDQAGNESAPASDDIILDRTFPVISAVSVDYANVTDSSVVVTWLTDELEGASSQVEYGLDESYGLSSPLGSTPVTSHSVTVSGLLPATAYHYRVRSTDPAGNETVSGDYTFVTRPEPPSTLVVARRTGSLIYLDLSWGSVWGAANYIVYKRDVLAGGPWAVFTTVTGTTATDSVGLHDTFSFDYYVTAVNSLGAPDGESGPSNTVSAVGNGLPPVISNVAAATAQLTCLVTWDTDESSTSQVRFGTVSGHYTSETTVDPALVTGHSVTVTGLEAGTTYYYVVVSSDATGDTATSTEYSFATTGRTIPPAPYNLRGGREIGQGNKVVVQWDAAPMANGYRLWSRDVLDPSNPGVPNPNPGPWVLLTDTTDLQINDGRYGPHGSFHYEYYVVAYNELGESPESEHLWYFEAD